MDNNNRNNNSWLLVVWGLICIFFYLFLFSNNAYAAIGAASRALCFADLEKAITYVDNRTVCSYNKLECSIHTISGQQYYLMSWQGSGSYTNPANCPVGNVGSLFQISQQDLNPVPSGVSRGVGYLYKPDPNNSYAWSAYRYSQTTPDPDPDDCSQLAGKTFINFKAPTANGSGTVCYLGCQASVALQAPPLPLFEGLWENKSCSVDNAVPASDPSTDPCAGKDPQTCSGTQTPTDPSTPPDSAGGGIQCDSAPYCNGDGVQCSLLYQTWLSRCETQNNGLSNDSNFDKINDSINSGTGQIVDKLDDVIDQQQTTNNKLDTLNNSVNGLGDDLNDINNSVNNNTNTLNELGNSLTAGADQIDGAESGLSGLVRNISLNPDGFDSSGLGFPRVCPRWQDVSFSIGVSAITIPLSTFDIHCVIFEWTGYLILAFAGYTASRILLKGD